MKRLMLMLAAFVVGGCAHHPIVSSAGEAPGDPARGTVTKLKDHLKGKQHATIVFLHGVGDHCPGFALDDHFGYLNSEMLPKLSLSNAQSLRPAVAVPSSSFMPGSPDNAVSNIFYATRDFDLDLGDGAGIPVRVIEITWSPLTQWVKNVQLGYDLTEPPQKPQSDTEKCPANFELAPNSLPKRQVVNRLIKEELLDRSLVDTILYAGSYGNVMRRGVAQALCLSLGGSPPASIPPPPPGSSPQSALCQWPSRMANPDANDDAYFFVTHSLGSRLIYDTLLGLSGHDVSATAQTFSKDEIDRGRPGLNDIFANTESLYMMANQISLLGLAYEDGATASGAGPHPYLRALQESLTIAPESVLKTVAFRLLAATTRPAAEVPAPVAFGAQRLISAQARGVKVNKLEVVAFSDTNDLLTWSVPRWYQLLANNGVPGIDFTNVYVQNSTHWLGLVENPDDAHEGYFSSKEVWSVIRCGAKKGVVLQDCK